MFTYTTRWLNRGEAWYLPETPQAAVDLVQYQQLPSPIPWALSKPFHTYVIPLDAPLDEIFARFSRTTRREIRRGLEQTGIRCVVLTQPTDADFDTFHRAFAEFARVKGRPPLIRSRLRQMAEAGKLWISMAYAPNGDVLSANLDLASHDRLRGLFGASPFCRHEDPAQRRLASEAGRMLVWAGTQAAHAAGYRYYDFGGWYTGQTDRQRLAINEYKGCFGGRVVCEYNCQRAFSLRGFLGMLASALPLGYRPALAHNFFRLFRPAATGTISLRAFALMTDSEFIGWDRVSALAQIAEKGWGV